MKFSKALITGATSGIGTALCARLSRENIPLIITGRNEKSLIELAGKFSLQEAIQADLLIESDRSKILHKIKESVPDIIINNAGIGLYGSILSHSVEKELDILEINCKALLEITLTAVKSLQESGKQGVILNVSSVAAFFPFPHASIYAATKAFVLSLSQSLDFELAPQGIRVLVSCPGMVDTEFSKRAGGKSYNRSLSMTPEYAAERIWKQVRTGKKCDVFDWKYRLLHILGALVPKKMVAKILQQNIMERVLPQDKRY